jgi:beta-lactamase superfamily II metal-dependent hydrolase
VRDFLLSQGVKRLAFAQISHPELDHVKGLHQLLQPFELEIFFALPESLRRNTLANLRELISTRVVGKATQMVLASPGAVMWQEPEHDFRIFGL